MNAFDAGNRRAGESRTLIRGRREVGGIPCGYLLVIVRSADQLHAFEAWGPQTGFDPLYDALVASALSLKR